MYNLMRRVHLFSAFTLLVFILLYAVSGLVMEFPKLWPPDVAAPTTRSAPFNYAALPGAPDSPASVAYVKDVCGLHGKPSGVHLNKATGTCDYKFEGVHGIDAARLLKDADHITITERPAGLLAALHRLHHLTGFVGGGVYPVWGVIFDLACAGLLLFAVSGVYLWHKLTRRHALGWILLAAGMGFTLAVAGWSILAR